MPSSPQTPSGDQTRQWELSEDGGGFLRTQEDTQDDITHVFAHDGTLLTGSSGGWPGGVAETNAPTSAGGRLGRMLRYYMGNAGRRVVLHDGRGARWPARITSTRWHGKRHGRLWSFVSLGRKAPGAATNDEQSAPGG